MSAILVAAGIISIIWTVVVLTNNSSIFVILAETLADIELN